MLKVNIKNNPRGFTLLELLLYITLMGILVLAASSFITMTFSAKIKNKTISEVEQQGEIIAYLISQSIKNSSGLNSPTTGNNASSLSLSSGDILQNPIIFSLVGGNIMVSYVGGANINLNNNFVTASNLIFYNLSYPGTSGNLKAQFTLSATDSYGRSEYIYSKNFSVTASKR